MLPSSLSRWIVCLPHNRASAWYDFLTSCRWSTTCSCNFVDSCLSKFCFDLPQARSDRSSLLVLRDPQRIVGYFFRTTTLQHVRASVLLKCSLRLVTLDTAEDVPAPNRVPGFAELLGLELRDDGVVFFLELRVTASRRLRSFWKRAYNPCGCWTAVCTTASSVIHVRPWCSGAASQNNWICQQIVSEHRFLRQSGQAGFSNFLLSV